MVDIVKCQMLKIAINRLEILEKRGFTDSRFLKQLEFRLKDRLVEQISIDWVPALKHPLEIGFCIISRTVAPEIRNG